MVNLEFDELFILDLRDDVYGNYTLKLYEFLGKDVKRAFYFGSFVKIWFPKLDQERQLLYSKQLRHSHEGLEKYSEQIKFWTDRFSDEEEVDGIQLSEYILNNMFWDEKTEDKDKIKLALFLGSKTNIQYDFKE